MRIVLFTGKGGVGKTTAAAATALRLADRGERTLLLSTDTAHSLADALQASLGGEPAPVAENLWAVQIDTQGRFEAAWRDVQSMLIDMLTRGGVDPITADELTVLPGVDEVLALLAVRELAVSGDWDVVVVDCAPTAETLRLLALPDALGWYLQRVFPAQRKIARSMRTFATLIGRGDVIPPDTMFESLLRLNDELAAVRELLGDSATTSVRLVLTPEAVVVAEAQRTFTAMALYGYRIGAIIANRVFAPGGDEWRQGWVRAQRVQLERVRESFAGAPVHEVSYAAAEPVGAVGLRTVAEELYGALPGDDPVPVTYGPPPLQVARAGGGYVLRMALPLAERGSVDAVRAGDDLIITVGANRRILTLPSMLRRCVVAGGSFDGTQLQVRFVPDPDGQPEPADHGPAEHGSTRRGPRPAPRAAASPAQSRPRPRPGGRHAARQHADD